jgi:hypothetical protein
MSHRSRVDTKSKAVLLRKIASQRPARLPKWFAGLLILGIAAGALVVSWEFVEPRFVVKRFGVVVPGAIYRSGQISPSLIESTLREFAIGVVVNLQCDDPHDAYQRAELDAARRLGVEHRRFPLSGDGTGDIRHYADAIEVLARSRKNRQVVLIHCAAGAQRTGAVVAAYRLLVEQQPPAEVIREMEKYGCTLARERDLLTYLNDNLPELARLLVERGVIELAPDPLPQLDP